jgi:spore coat polysaccharide biosynthesis protein SpsF
MTKVATIIQARMGSNRLPGKVLEHVAGEPVLHWVVLRASRATAHGELVVATSDLSRDDPIADWCAAAGIPCFRASENDVLDRYYQASQWIGADVIVRVTADCPLLDPAIVDDMVEVHVRESADYVTMEGLPRGIAQETLSREALTTSWREARASAEREHVIPYVVDRPERFKVLALPAPPDLNLPAWRITLDDEDDLRLLRSLADIMDEELFNLATGEIIDLIRQDPALIRLACRVGGSGD